MKQQHNTPSGRCFSKIPKKTENSKLSLLHQGHNLVQNQQRIYENHLLLAPSSLTQLQNCKSAAMMNASPAAHAPSDEYNFLLIL